MSLTNTSTLFNSNGQFFSTSQYQGSVYQQVTFASPLLWDRQFTVTEPLGPAINGDTISNYPVMPNEYFMGSFDGFWIHRVYCSGRLVATIQTVNQDMFIPLVHDRVESLAMGSGFLDGAPGMASTVIPAPGAVVVLSVAAVLAKRRTFNVQR